MLPSEGRVSLATWWRSLLVVDECDELHLIGVRRVLGNFESLAKRHTA